MFGLFHDPISAQSESKINGKAKGLKSRSEASMILSFRSADHVRLYIDEPVENAPEPT
jgi:hypothetical protein